MKSMPIKDGGCSAFFAAAEGFLVGDGGFGVAGGFAGAGEEERRLDDLEPMVGVAAVLLLRRPGDAAARFDGLREGLGEGGIMINYRRRRGWMR